VGHFGQYGSMCVLKPLQDELTFVEEGKKVDSLNGAQASISDKKLDDLSEKFERLMTVVTGLADKVVSSEKRLDSVVAAGVDNAGKSVQEVSKSSTVLSKPTGSGSGTGSAKEQPTTQSLARDAELTRLLDRYNADSEDMLQAQDAVNSRVPSSASNSFQGENRLKKVNLIPDFITSCSGIGLEEEDDELLTKNGRSFKLQGKNKRPDAKDVMQAQWMSANIAILEHLLPSMSVSEVSDYYSYTRHIGDLLQIYTSASVFHMDNEHRKDVAKGLRKWSEITIYMVSFYLVRLRGSGGNAGGSTSDSSTGGGSSSNGGNRRNNRFNHPCTRYNSREGCDNASCKFQPVCSIRGCRGDHPKYKHPNVGGEDFRKNGPGAANKT
jgi:hypothetical protein